MQFPELFKELNKVKKEGLFFNHYFSTATSTLMVIGDIMYGGKEQYEVCSSLDFIPTEYFYKESLFDELKNNPYMREPIEHGDSLSDKEKIVIQKRIWLNCEKETLQNIWNSFTPNITRERVRQIEDSWIKKIWRIIKASNLEVIQAFTKKHLDLVWGLLTKDKLINEIIKNFKFDENINQNVIESIVHSDFDIVKSKPKCGTQTYFHLPNISKKNIEIIHKEAVKVAKKGCLCTVLVD